MKTRERLVSITLLLLCAIAASATTALGQPGRQRDPLDPLKRALNEANAPALTSQQETQLTELITTFRNGQMTGPDAALEAAHTAYDSAILAGDLAAAQAQAAIIGSHTGAKGTARLQASAKLEIDVLAILKGGGQLDALRQKFGDERLVGIVGSLAGGPPFGGGRPPGRPEGGRPEGGPGFGPGRRPPGPDGNQN